MGLAVRSASHSLSLGNFGDRRLRTSNGLKRGQTSSSMALSANARRASSPLRAAQLSVLGIYVLCSLVLVFAYVSPPFVYYFQADPESLRTRVEHGDELLRWAVAMLVAAWLSIRIWAYLVRGKQPMPALMSMVADTLCLLGIVVVAGAYFLKAGRPHTIGVNAAYCRSQGVGLLLFGWVVLLWGKLHRLVP